MITLVNIIIMFSSFFMAYFVKDIITIVNHKLILYCSVSFLLASRIVHFPSFFIDRSGYLLFCRSVKAKKSGKYFSTSSGVCSLFVMWYIFCGIGTHFLIIFNILSFVDLCKCCSDLNQRESPPKCR